MVGGMSRCEVNRHVIDLLPDFFKAGHG